VPRDLTTTIVAWVATIVAVFAFAGGLYLEKEREKLKDRISDVRLELRDTTQILTTRDADFARRDAMDAAVAEISRRMQELERRQDAFDAQVERLRATSEGAREAWMRSEIEHVLHAAVRAVEVDRDPVSALNALRAIQRTLERWADPAWATVLERIAVDIAALERVPPVDMESIVITLDGIGNGAHALPLAQVHGVPRTERRPAETGFAGVDWSGVWRSIKSNFREMVTVRREGRPERVLLAPEEVQAIHLNLQLNLEAARFAGLRRDADNYRMGLRNARRWVETWYDTDDVTVQAVLDELDLLGRRELEPELPDLSGSVRALRSVR
jgi:uroporphyrin-3 C-methyltransferase